MRKNTLGGSPLKRKETGQYVTMPVPGQVQKTQSRVSLIRKEITKRQSVMSATKSDSIVAEQNFFFGTDTLSQVVVNNQKRIIKIDLRTFKQLYTKLFDGKYLVAMFVFLKRRMDTLRKATKTAQSSPQKRGSNPGSPSRYLLSPAKTRESNDSISKSVILSRFKRHLEGSFGSAQGEKAMSAIIASQKDLKRTGSSGSAASKFKSETPWFKKIKEIKKQEPK